MSAALSLSLGWRARAARWFTRPRPCASCRCIPNVRLVDRRCPACRVGPVARPSPVRASRTFFCEADVVTALASGSGPPDARKVELDTFGRRIISKWSGAGRPEPLEPKPTYQRPSRARQRGESPADERVTRPLSKAEERLALELLATRFVRPEHLDKRRCLTCAKGMCRCEWRSEVWLELVSPRASVAKVDDLEKRIELAAGRVESRNRRDWGKL